MHDLRDDNINDLITKFTEIQKRFADAKSDLITQAEIADAMRIEFCLSQVEVDNMLADSGGWSSRHLWLASLSDDTKALIREGSMTKDAAKPLWPLPKEMQDEILVRIFRDEIDPQSVNLVARLVEEMVPDYAKYVESARLEHAPHKPELIAIARKFVTTNPAGIALVELRQALPLMAKVLDRLCSQSDVRLAVAAADDQELLGLLKSIRQLLPLLGESEIRIAQSWKRKLDEKMKSE